LFGTTLVDSKNLGAIAGVRGTITLEKGYIYKFEVMANTGNTGGNALWLGMINQGSGSSGEKGHYGIGFYDLRSVTSDTIINWDTSKEIGANGGGGEGGQLWWDGDYKGDVISGTGGKGGASAEITLGNGTPLITVKGGKGGNGGSCTSVVPAKTLVGGTGGEGGGADFLHPSVQSIADVTAQIRQGAQLPVGWDSQRVVITKYIDALTYYSRVVVELLISAKNIQRNLFTTASLNDLDDATAYAGEILTHDVLMTQADIIRAKELLEYALEHLTTKQYDSLQTLYNTAALTVNLPYKASTWNKLQTEIGLTYAMLAAVATNDANMIMQLSVRGVQLQSALNGLMTEEYYDTQGAIRDEIAELLNTFLLTHNMATYTADSWNAVMNAFLSVPAVGGGVTQETLQQNKTNIIAAINNLTLQVWQDLCDRICWLEMNLNAVMYTPESWAEYTPIFHSARGVSEATTGHDIGDNRHLLTEALEQLDAAVDGLVLKDAEILWHDLLIDLVSRIGQPKQADFAPEQWNAFYTALTDAKTAIADAPDEQPEFWQNLYTNLKTAHEALVPPQIVPPTDPEIIPPSTDGGNTENNDKNSGLTFVYVGLIFGALALGVALVTFVFVKKTNDKRKSHKNNRVRVKKA
jgi:hypothetical protein